jgi:glycosyltransferase involved in cell wall biosynthesis
VTAPAPPRWYAAGERRGWARVVMIGPSPQQRGGIASVVAAYVQAGLIERWDVKLVVSAADGSSSRWRKAQVAAWALLDYAGQLLLGRVRLAHVHLSSYGSFWRKLPFCAITRAAGRPLVIHLHGGAFGDFYAQCGPLGRACIGWCLRQADALIALSPSWQLRLQDLVGRSDVHVVPNPVSLPAAALMEAPAATPQAQPQRLLFLGKVCAPKGVHDLLQALAMLRETCPNVHLTLAGDGELAQAWQWIDALALNDHVTLTGWVDGAAKQALWQQATLLVLPSHAEGVPMCILEAHSQGVPVVATRVGGIPDVVEHGVQGWLVPPHEPAALAQALLHLLQEPELRAELARNAQAATQARYAVGVVVQQVEAIYREVLERGAHAG